MRDILRPGIVLLIVTVIAAGLLGVVNEVTKDAIALNSMGVVGESIKEMLPDNNVSFGEQIIVEPEPEIGVKSYFIAQQQEQELGYMFIVKQLGYGGEMELLVGVDLTGHVIGIDLVEHKETPGLGAKTDNAEFKSQFIGKSGDLVVTIKGATTDNEIDSVTSATISSTAVTDGVNKALDYYREIIGGAN